jgi:hypothetical protein
MFFPYPAPPIGSLMFRVCVAITLLFSTRHEVDDSLKCNFDCSIRLFHFRARTFHSIPEIVNPPKNLFEGDGRTTLESPRSDSHQFSRANGRKLDFSQNMIFDSDYFPGMQTKAVPIIISGRPITSVTCAKDTPQIMKLSSAQSSLPFCIYSVAEADNTLHSGTTLDHF